MKPALAGIFVLGFLLWSHPGAAAPSSDLPPGWDASRYLPVEAIQPGMKAVGRSVFVGTRVDTFSAEILGVVQTASPGGEMIVARLSGQGLEESGVIAGMSGSPIYIDGRLIGALAFGWPFASEPIAGITPIAEMLRLFERSGGGSPGGSPESRTGFAPERWQRLWSARGKEAWGPLLEGLPSSFGEPAPLQVPASLSGFDPAVQGETTAILEGMGLLAVQGGQVSGTGASGSTPLVPGSPVGVALIRGDAQIGVTGTVTWSDGERILAFGHPMFSLGPTRFPLCAAEVITVLPRLNSSFKLSAIGETVGTLSRDYRTGVVGELGPSPELIPMGVDLTIGGRTENLTYELVDSDLITPVLAGIASMNSVAALTRSTGASTVRMEIEVTLADGRVLSSNSVQAGFSPPTALGGEVARLVGLLAGNPFEEVSVNRIHVAVTLEEEIEAAFLDAIAVGPGPYRPGDRVPVELELRDYRGGTQRVNTSLTIPVSTSPGTYELSVCDGNQASREEQERAPGVYSPKSLDQMIGLVEDSPPYNHVVLRLYQNATSPVIAGREFPRLPGSLQSVLESPLSGGRNEAAQKTVIVEGKEILSRIVLGCQTLSLPVEARR